MRFIVTILFSLITTVGWTQSVEQIAFNSFIKDYEDRISEFKFHGKTTKTYTGGFVDYSTCFHSEEHKLDSFAESLNKLNDDRFKIDFSKKDFSKKSKSHQLKVHKATKLDNKFVIRIEAVKDNHILEYYYLIDSTFKVFDNCHRNIVVD
uniref:hypothetical protein n=1 Tax=Fulvivirga sp. TaxID=1931237 RepID=UPI0040495523